MAAEEKEEKEFHKVPAMIVSVLVPMAFLGVLYFTLGIGVDTKDVSTSFLYRFVKGSEVRKWFLIALFVLSQSVIIYSVMRLRRIRAFLVPLATLALLFAYLKMSANLSAFCISAMLVAAAYSCLISDRDETGTSVCFFVLQLAAYLLHPQAMLFLQPIGGLVLMGISHAERERMHIGFLKILFSILLVLALGAGIRVLTNKLIKDGERLKAVVEQQTDTTVSGDTLEEDIEAATGTQAKQTMKKAKNVKGPVAIAKRVYEQSILKSEVQPVVVLLVFCVAMMFVLAKLRYLWVLGGLLLGHVISWGILLSKGSIDDEFAVSFLFAEALMLFMILLSMLDVGKVFKKKKWIKQTIAITGLCFFFFAAFLTAKRGWRSVENTRQNCTNTVECDKVILYGGTKQGGLAK